MMNPLDVIESIAKSPTLGPITDQTDIDEWVHIANRLAALIKFPLIEKRDGPSDIETVLNHLIARCVQPNSVAGKIVESHSRSDYSEISFFSLLKASYASSSTLIGHVKALRDSSQDSISSNPVTYVHRMKQLCANAKVENEEVMIAWAMAGLQLHWNERLPVDISNTKKWNDFTNVIVQTYSRFSSTTNSPTGNVLAQTASVLYCTNCGGVNHRKDVCPSPINLKPFDFSNIQCYRCDRFGHYSRDCPTVGNSPSIPQNPSPSRGSGRGRPGARRARGSRGRGKKSVNSTQICFQGWKMERWRDS